MLLKFCRYCVFDGFRMQIETTTGFIGIQCQIKSNGVRKMKSITYTLLLALLWGMNAEAALVSGNVTGTVDTFADPGNIFGLGLGDTIELNVVFDDAGLTGMGGETVFFNLPGNTMEFTVGLLTFTEDMDTAGGVGPTLFFFDGVLSEIKYDTQFGSSGLFFSFIQFFEGSDDAGNGIGGNWDMGSYTESPVVIPLPPAVWLFGSGLIGLIGIARRKKS